MFLVPPSISGTCEPPEGVDVAWRAEDRLRSHYVGDDHSYSTVGIHVFWNRIDKFTPCGIRLASGRFVNLKKQKKWATLTKAEAFDQLYHRKKRQIEILEVKIRRARQAMNKVQDL